MALLDDNVLSSIPLKPESYFDSKKKVRATASSISVMVNSCPRQFDARYGVVMAKVPYVQNPAALAGDAMHKACERYLKFGAEIPPKIAAIYPNLKKKLDVYKSMPSFKAHLVEGTIGVSTDGAAAWWSHAMGCKSDLLMDLPNNHKLYVDWKSNDTKNYKGVYKPPKLDTIQVEVTACTAFMADPTLQRMTVVIEFLKHDARIIAHMDRSKDTYTVVNHKGEVFTHDYELPGQLAEYWFRQDTKTFPPQPGGLCAGWCGVTQCEHWKPKK